MGLDFDVLEFCKKLKQDRPPPYQCPLEKCDRTYKSLCGLQYHLVKYDHDNPTPITPVVAALRKKGGRSRAPVPTGDIALQSPPKEALTFAEAAKAVQFEIDGKVSSIPIDQPLDLMPLEEWERLSAQMEKPLAIVEPPPEPQIQLPEANFKRLPDYKICDAPPRPNAYIRFIEKSAEELDGEVEYDADEEDTAWLMLLNKQRAKQGLPPVSIDTLELIMDRLEKEAYILAAQTGQEQATTVDDDAVCSICMDGECQNTNVILFCDMCNLAVHQDCYGVPYIPEGQWLCRRCLQAPSQQINCVLCPNTGGAFKQTDQGRWAHVVCALWIPEVRFANTVFLEPIDCIEAIPAARWRLCCLVCKQRGAGACIQCHKSNCYHAFHVTCAQQAGLYMKMDAVGRGPGQPVQVNKIAFCDAHTPAHVVQEKNADNENEHSNKSTTMALYRQEAAEKIKQARRQLALKRRSPTESRAPRLTLSRASAALHQAGHNAPAVLLKKLVPYWSLKRAHRPLLRRLHATVTNHGRGLKDGSVNIRELCNQLKYWQRIRQDLERARLLCELVRKRERVKAEFTRVSERALLRELRPERAVLSTLLNRVARCDSADIFGEPVDTTEVQDYSTVVKFPMDLSTMSKKLENGEYETMDDMYRDFILMIDNCLAYNSKDTVFYKAGLKMREQCLPIFHEARQDMIEAGFCDLAGKMELGVVEHTTKSGREKSQDSSHDTKKVTSSKRAKSVVQDTENPRELRRGVSVGRELKQGVSSSRESKREKSEARDKSAVTETPRETRRDKNLLHESKQEKSVPRERRREKSVPRDTKREKSVPRDAKREKSVPRDAKREKSQPRESKMKKVSPREPKRETSARENKRESSLQESKRESLPQENKRERLPQETKRESSGRESKRESSARESKHENSARESKRESSGKESKQVSSTRESKPESSTRESKRESSARENKREISTRDSKREILVRESKRESSTRECKREEVAKDVKEKKSDKFELKPLKRSKRESRRGESAARESKRSESELEEKLGRSGLRSRKPVVDEPSETNSQDTEEDSSTSGPRAWWWRKSTGEPQPTNSIFSNRLKPLTDSPLTIGSKNFGADAKLPTLSSMREDSPKKKGRGRPKKIDKENDTSIGDSFSRPQTESVPASFREYRGTRGEAGSDSDPNQSDGTNSSLAWSCSSCTHYDHSSSSSSDIDWTDDERRQCEEESRQWPLKSQLSRAKLEPLQLVWAKTRGYPWYPALIIDPKIRRGATFRGIPLPTPPLKVLNLKEKQPDEPVLYLVLFFDAKRTWQWLPPSKLEPLGIDKSIDKSKLSECKKPRERKAVKKAYGDAITFSRQIGDGPDDEQSD